VGAQSFKGQCASPGYASGHVITLDTVSSIRESSGESALESRALQSAIASAIAQLQDIAGRAEGEAADMLGFQIAMLEDDALSQAAFDAIAGGTPAGAAWTDALEIEIAGYTASEEEYFRARASDLDDMRNRVLDILNGVSAKVITPGSILLADDITPSRFLGADWQGGAILLRKGSATSHVAMLARAGGVPMIVGLQIADIRGRAVLVDAAEGAVLVDPAPMDTARFEKERSASAARAALTAVFLGQPAITKDGTAITTLINIGDPAELEAINPAICDGIGLVRTELLFEGKPLPDEETQVAIYTKIVQWAAGRPVTFRTLDAGGDKPIMGLTPDGESNPFLGVRGVRLTLKRPEIFLPQLKALARAAAHGAVEVMIPMVALPSELEAARTLLHRACDELARDGVRHRLPALGMMVEVPAAALTLDQFDAAFLSIGSNDLTQYVMAAGRDIADVADLADTGHEAVLRLIGIVAEHGRRSGVKVSLCGDAGGDARLIPLLLAKGIRTLSMSPRLLARAKQTISTVVLGDAA
jgi:phosphoenolpyruvate-protein phosphotransferase (PTS system enzyme I)